MSFSRKALNVDEGRARALDYYLLSAGCVCVASIGFLLADAGLYNIRLYRKSFSHLSSSSISVYMPMTQYMRGLIEINAANVC